MEAGEECDCGSPNNCKSICCDPHTCKLSQNATCATGKCCNLEKCQLKPQGAYCREAKGECDLPEVCNGFSEFCPDDLFKRDTEECGHEEYCFNGTCRSNDRQCKFLWGFTAKSSEQCIETFNKKDQECGLLYCEDVGDLQLTTYAMTTIHEITTTVGRVKSVKKCKSLKLSLNIAEDLTFAPNGKRITFSYITYTQRPKINPN